MKDADSQQCNKILGAMETVFVNALEGTCGFHVVNMGWKRFVLSVGISNSNIAKWSVVVIKIKKWIHYWMRPGYVEDVEEYNTSKYLLKKFVCLLPVSGIVDGSLFIVRSILKFLNGHVHTWETLF
jgi:hypothetical protein